MINAGFIGFYPNQWIIDARDQSLSFLTAAVCVLKIKTTLDLVVSLAAFLAWHRLQFLYSHGLTRSH